jgi:hypothetical protein
MAQYLLKNSFKVRVCFFLFTMNFVGQLDSHVCFQVNHLSPPPRIVLPEHEHLDAVAHVDPGANNTLTPVVCEGQLQALQGVSFLWACALKSAHTDVSDQALQHLLGLYDSACASDTAQLIR